MSSDVIEYGGKRFRHLFPDLIRPPTAGEEKSLYASIAKKKFGVRRAITVNDLDADPIGVADGWTRLRIAVERQIPLAEIAFDQHSDLNCAELRQLALDFHTVGRVLSPEERKALVAKGIAEGKSKRRIAKELGIDEGTVRMDGATADDSAVAPKKSEGADGKERPATRLTAAALQDRQDHALEFFEADKTIAEIAEVFDVSPRTIKSDLAAAKKRREEAAQTDQLRDELDAAGKQPLRVLLRQTTIHLGAKTRLRFPGYDEVFVLGDAVLADE